MYKLKEQYVGVVLTKNGNTITLDNVKPEEVELLGIEHYFSKDKPPKKSKKTNK